MAGAVEQSLAALQEEIHDSLAPWPLIRTFAQHVLTATLLHLADEDSPPVDTGAIDRDLAEDIVARDIPLTDITQTMRRIQHEWLSLLIDAAVGVRPDGISVVPALATSVTGTVDAWIGAATDAIIEERRRVYLAEQVRIRSAIESLVKAEPVDVEAATQLLRIPLIGWHISCAIGVPPGGTVERRVLDGPVHLFARVVGSEQMLRYETSAGTIHLWVTTDRPGRTPRVEDLRVPAPLLVGIGEPHPGADGFRRTFLEASDALRLAARLRANGGVSYGDAALAIVLSRDEERARWFVEHELRDLAADNPEMADMRNTLRTFFDTRMRIAPAADRLFLHRNTLINRLDRIQAALGHGVAERPAETQAALVLAELFARRPDDPAAGRDEFGA
ncbi:MULTISPECIES: helix-turn-helix domain-containing protein [unclassified Diaminobutyricimonas]|uniref:PucR family transcriptional regulator n=1 Tax=unclassified Diaminobutyricimonas TaxID=2643261 RepID=UPI0012F513C7|nr:MULTISPECIES: helix-turn-helix domain-containing protein [unclassified Diaminobutyricimonas]